mgnify:CR=1 FL=1
MYQIEVWQPSLFCCVLWCFICQSHTCSQAIDRYEKQMSPTRGLVEGRPQSTSWQQAANGAFPDQPPSPTSKHAPRYQPGGKVGFHLLSSKIQMIAMLNVD